MKCAACAHSWVVEDEGLTLNEPVEPSFDVSEAAPEPSAADFEDDPAPSIREKPAAAVRARAEQQRRKQAMAVEGAGWAGVAACVAVALISAVIFRVNIVQTLAAHRRRLCGGGHGHQSLWPGSGYADRQL